MKSLKYLLIALLFTMFGCGKDDDAGGEAGAAKGFLSLWTNSETSVFVLDFRTGSFNQNQTLYLSLPITQGWIDDLNAAGRDTTGLVAEDIYYCEMTMYILGDDSSGQFATNHDDVDTPAHNACLEWDSNCVIGSCNYDGDHLYEIVGDILYIDWFGIADGDYYGSDSFN